MGFENLSRSDIECLINEWILSERDRKIMKRRLTDGISIESLAEEFEMSPRQIQRIVTKLSAKLREKCF